MKKISVMIVDDEKLAIEDLSTIVDWDALGFEIVATACNGRQALGKFNQFRPQVVFTDIKMPYMDGIELIGRLRELDSQVKILMLTAYEDFSYAKSAIQFGITDYIIKSEINAQSFMEVLCKLRRAINTQDKDREILNDKKISDFFRSGTRSGEALFTTPWCYLLVEQDLPVNLSGDDVETVRCSRTALLSTLTAEEDKTCRLVAASAVSPDQMLLVLELREVSQSAMGQQLHRYAAEVKARLEDQFQSAFTVYLAASRMTLENLRRVYLQNSLLFQRKYLDGCGCIVDLLAYRPTPRKAAAPEFGELEGLVARLDGAAAGRWLDELFQALAADGAYRSLHDAARELYELLRRSYDALPDFAEKPDLSFAVNWRYWLDAARLHKWFRTQFQNLIRAKEEVYRHGYSKPIVKAIDYILHSYPNCDLTINDIAGAVHLSAGHLCALFKKETGKTLKNYITEVRVSAAKSLLEEGELKVYEISSAVGYQSSQYFSQVFYKQTGIYPTEYQKGKKSDPAARP